MIGTKLSDRYEILSELGRGGMGVVYKAHDPLLNREVAIKLIPPTMLNPDAEARFRSEAQTVAKMDHPSIVPIFDIGDHQGSLFFVMPVLQGQSMRQHLRDQTMTLGDVIDGAIQIAEALEYSHARGILHRDIKPENLMVAKDGDQVRFRVMDFGLARDTAVSRFTRTGMFVGTMGYVSPEQVMGKPVDGRSDLYALGTVLYEAITSELPFSGEMQSILYRIVHEIPQPPRDLGANIDEELESIVLACLEKDPARRPQKAADLARTLRGYRARHQDSQRMHSMLLTQAASTPRPALAPFVGREREMKELQQRLHAAKRGECQLVLVAGEAGIGKTRLLDELEALARAQQIRVLHGRFVEEVGAFPYHGFCEVIQDYFRQKDSGSSSGAHPDFSDLGSELIALFPMLGEVEEIRSIAVSSPESSPADATPAAEKKNQIFELLARTLTRLAGGKPCVLLLEDLHGAEVSMEALQYIVRRLGPTPTLIVGTYRPAEVDRRSPLSRLIDGFEGDPRYANVSLGPLSPSEHGELLATLLGGREIDTQLSRRLYEGSEGNPFFTKELIRSLLDSGTIAQDATGSWALSMGASIASDELPATIQQAVERRIAGLPPALLQILSTAAVMGKTFEFEDLEALLGGQEDLDEAVERLVQEGLVEEERRSRGDALSFTSGVVREVLYAKLSRRKRRSLHAKYAELLEKEHAGRLERVYPQLVYHYAEGDVPEKTVEYGLLHARKSIETHSPEETIRAARRSLEFLDDQWEGDRTLEGDAHLLVASGHQMSGEIAEALHEVEAAIAVFDRERRADRAVDAILSAARMAWRARRPEDMSLWVERGLTAARAAGGAEKLVEFLSLAATLANLRADYARANAYLQEAERLRPSVAPGRGEDIPEGGRLVVGIANPVGVIDPALIGYDEQVEISANVFETLIATDEEGRLVPWLCRSWEVADEGRLFRFALREDVRFHDGHPLSARTVKECLEESIRLRGPGVRAALSSIEGARAFLAGEAADVTGMSVRSERELEIRLIEPLPIYPALLTEHDTALARRDPARSAAESRTLGTGAFRVVSLEPGRIVIERNSDYWMTPPRLDAVEFLTGMQSSAIAEGLRSGNLDVGRDLPVADLDELQRDPRFKGRLCESPGRHTFFALFNTRSGPVGSDPGIRRALSRGVRVADLVWKTKGRLAEPASSLIPPGILGHDAGRRRESMSLDEARAALGAGSGTPVSVRVAISPTNQDRHRTFLDALFAAWTELGTKPVVVTPGQQEYDRVARDPSGVDVMVGGWIADYDDPDAMTNHLFGSEAGVYRNLFASPEADELLQKARSEIRPEARVGLYRRFESMLEETGAVLPLFHEAKYVLPGSRVRGIRLRSTPPYVNYRELGKSAQDLAPEETRTVSETVLRFGIVGSLIRSLDPAITTHVQDGEIISTVFEPLTRVGEGGRIVPWLASRMEVEEGGKRYRFRLREGVRYHDGRRLVARDVRHSFERVLTSPDCEFRGLLQPVRGAEAMIRGEARELEGLRIHSASDFSLELERPFPFLPAVLSHVGFGIVPEGAHLPSRSFRDGCVGTGPFRVVRFEPGQRVELERNPQYWRPGYPRSQNLVFELVPTGEDLYAGFRRGHFALAHDLSPVRFEELRRSSEFARGYAEVPGLALTLLAMNARKGVLRDPAARRRVLAALDREALLKTSMEATQSVPPGVIPPGLLGYDPAPRRREAPAPGPDATRIDGRAAEMELTLLIVPSLRSWAPDLEPQFVAMLGRHGMRVRTLEARSREEWKRLIGDGESDLFLGAWAADYPDSHGIVHGLFDSREGYFAAYVGSGDLDALIEKAQVETDTSTREALYRRIEDHVAREALSIPFFYVQVYRFARPDLEGLSLSFTSPYVNYETLRFRPS